MGGKREGRSKEQVHLVNSGRAGKGQGGTTPLPALASASQQRRVLVAGGEHRQRSAAC